MTWVALLGIVVMVAASVSLYGTWDTRRDLASGHPSYLSLADHTGIWNRAELARLCGSPDANDRYTVSHSTAAALPRRAWIQLLDSPWLDALCILTAVWAIALNACGSGVAGACVSMPLIYQAVSWAWALGQVLRHAHCSS